MRGSRKDHVIKRHGKTGFWYCAQCKRVRKGWQSPRNQLDMGIIPVDAFGKGVNQEAQLHMEGDGSSLIKNYPLTTRSTPYGEPILTKTEKR